MHVKKVTIGESVATTRETARGVEEHGEFRGKRVANSPLGCFVDKPECCILPNNRCGTSARGSQAQSNNAYCFYSCKDGINDGAFDEDLTDTGNTGRSASPLKVADGACTENGTAVLNRASPDFCPEGFGNYSLVAAGLATAPPPSIPTPTPIQNDQANSRVLQNIPSASLAVAPTPGLRGSANGIPKAAERTSARVQETLSWDEAQQIIATRSQSVPAQTVALTQTTSLLAPSNLLGVTAATTTGVVVASNVAAIASAAVALVACVGVLGAAIYFAVRAFKKQKETATRVAPAPVELTVIENPTPEREDSRPDSARSRATLDDIESIARGNIKVARETIDRVTRQPMRRSRSTLSLEHIAAISCAFKNSPQISNFFDTSFDQDCETIQSIYEGDASGIDQSVIDKFNAAFKDNIPPPKKLKVLPPIPHIPPPEAFV